MKDSHELLPAKINDAIRRSYLRGAPCFVGFLDAAGAALAENIAKGDRANYMLFGGYDGAERVYFGVFPDGFLPDGSLFPIVRLTVTDRSGRGFTHRDVLGTLMSEGIERSTVGDILIGSPDSALFVSASVAEHIMAETDKIASCGVTVARSEYCASGVTVMPVISRTELSDEAMSRYCASASRRACWPTEI